jgi:hypothetical protein
MASRDYWQRQILRAAKQHGLMFNPEAIKYLVDISLSENDFSLYTRVIESIDKSSRTRTFARLLRMLTRVQVQFNLVNVGVVQKITESFLQEENKEANEYLQVINAFDVPQWTYNPSRKTFTRFAAFCFFVARCAHTGRIDAARSQACLAMQRTKLECFAIVLIV